MSWFKKTEPGDPVDSGMKTYKVPGDRLVMIEARPGEIIPCDDPQKVVIVPPKDPEPTDCLSRSKPPDIVLFRPGLACNDRHVGALSPDNRVENIPNGTWLCSVCGKNCRPALIKEVKTHFLGYLSYRWENTVDHREFVHFLDSPKPRRKK
jgi:hypothetical protein